MTIFNQFVERARADPRHIVLPEGGDERVLAASVRAVADGDEAALIEAMDSRGIRAGLDVFADEPGASTAEFTSPLARHPSVVATPHVGASTEHAQDAVANGTIDAIEAYRDGEPTNCVNLLDVPALNDEMGHSQR